MKWENQTITSVEILSKAGKVCRIYAGRKLTVTKNGKKIASKTNKDGSVEFKTVKGGLYKLKI
jgi:hypothetical protein